VGSWWGSIVINSAGRSKMEFWQLLIGTLSGFLVAFLAEPVKTYFANRSKKAVLKVALYSEMALLYNRLTQLSDSLDKGELSADNLQWAVTEMGRFDCYNYARSKAFLLFYQLKEAPAIDAFYGSSRLLLSEHFDSKSKGWLTIPKQAKELLENLVKQGQISEKLLLKCSDITTRNLLEKRLN
jgi:polyhydroxyalkanoate synthesis regulator phasin